MVVIVKRVNGRVVKFIIWSYGHKNVSALIFTWLDRSATHSTWQIIPLSSSRLMHSLNLTPETPVGGHVSAARHSAELLKPNLTQIFSLVSALMGLFFFFKKKIICNFCNILFLLKRLLNAVMYGMSFFTAASSHFWRTFRFYDDLLQNTHYFPS